MRTDPEIKAHPDYSAGYFDAVDGKHSRTASAIYGIGYEAGEHAVQLLASAGFKRRGRSFTKRVARS